MSERGLELLSPAGSPEIARAVINAGCDAVYFGGNLFGARAYAANFTREEGAAIIRYAHLHGAKAYITINTLLKNREIEVQLYDYVKAYYESGVDAVLVQDLGVLNLIHSCFPDLELHASTQMTLANGWGGEWLRDFGIRRLVASRELSLAEMARIHEMTGMDLEAFVHGALCVCYSGQCLMSSIFGGRSGNRGRCAQPCRLPYDVISDDGSRLHTPGPYVLSMKDLCGVRDIPALDRSGVYSLKIEGRMKQLSYALGVVQVYRRMIDQYLTVGADGYRVDADTIHRLLDLGNRSGFTNVWYYKQNDRDMITYTEPSHQHRLTDADIPAESKIPVSGTFTAKICEPMEFVLSDASGHEVTVFGDVTQPASRHPAALEDVRKHLLKFGATSFHPVLMDVILDDGCFIPVGGINTMRREACHLLEEELIGVKIAGALPYAPAKERKDPSSDDTGDRLPVLSVSVMTGEQLEAAAGSQYIDEVIVESDLICALEASKWKMLAQKFSDRGVRTVVHLPLVLREKSEQWLDQLWDSHHLDEADGYLASSLDALGWLDHMDVDRSRVICDHRIYSWSDEAVGVLHRAGYRRLTAPVELNERELAHRDNTRGTMIVYGYLPLMVTTNCIVCDTTGCDHMPHHYRLKDRKGSSMTVLNRCASCYNLILNSVPLSLLHEIPSLERAGFANYRLDFTIEDAGQMEKIIGIAHSALRSHPADNPEGTTRGHYRRGVE